MYSPIRAEEKVLPNWIHQSSNRVVGALYSNQSSPNNCVAR